MHVSKGGTLNVEYTALAYISLGKAYAGLGNYNDTITYYKKALAIFKTLLPKKHQAITMATEDIAFFSNKLNL